ncbi:MAG: hypothetical protein GXX96_38425 [Planctomycetaceae bacterium]|nr:hypothetical protein [Planctomycetaceae bacterium]
MSRRAQIGILTAMVAAACAVQAVAIRRAPVPALDAVRYVNSARTIDEIGLLGFLRKQTEPPLFSMSVWGMHTILVAALGDFREAWAFSVQSAAALPLILLPIPVFLLGKRLAGPHAALLGTVLVACLPELIRLGADGISDSTHLLWFSLALVLLVFHLSPTGEGRLPVLPALLGGVATALAVLTRSEAVLLGIAFCVVISARGVRRRQLPWRSAIPYSAGLAAILVPYGLLLSVALSGSSSAADGGASEVAAHVSADFDLEEGEKPSFAPKDPTTSIRRRGVSAAAIALADEIPKAFGYLPGILALIGLWSLRRRGNTDADLLLQVFCVLLLGALAVHTTREGYLSARHVLPIVVAATACMGTGAQVVADRLKRILDGGALAGRSASGLAIVVTLLVAAICTAYGLRPLHLNRAGHRSAAEWLTRNASPGDRVLDTRGWTGLYSGLVTVPYENARSELSRPELRYLVIEDCETTYDSVRSRTIRRLVERAGTQVAAFAGPPTADHRSGCVLVFQWNCVRR